MKKLFFNKGNILFLLGAGAIILLVVLVAYSFIIQARQHELLETNANLAGITKSNVAAVRQTISEYITSLKMTAMLIETFDDFKSPEVMDMLKKIAEERGFARIAIDYPSGLSYTSDGYVFDFSSTGVLDRIAKGETFAGDVIDSFSDGEPIVNIYVPLHDKNGKPAASLRLALKTKTLDNIFNQIFWNSEGYFHLIDGRGRFVATSSKIEELLTKYNFYTSIDSLDVAPGFDKRKMLDDMTNNRDGVVEWIFNGEHKLVYHASTGVGGWTMMVIVPDNLMWEQTNENIRPAAAAVLQIMSVFAAVFAYVIIIKNRSRKQALLGEKCFRVLADQTEKIIFEWDFSGRPIIMYGNFEAQFGRAPATQHSEHDALDAGVIHPDDRSVFSSLFHHLQTGENVDNVKLRIKDVNDQFRLCLLNGVVVRKDNGEIYKAIVSLEDVEDKERERENLKFKAMIDPLTELYNKVSESYLVTEALSCSGKDDMHALVCFDLDGFKGINDKFGHLFGDTVLQDISDKLKQSLRTSDILGRFGGDEFVLFVKDVPNIEFAREKMNDIMKIISATYKVGDVAHSISASVGVAIYPRDGETYDELYEKADISSYKAKTEGKNRTIFYLDIERSVPK